MLNINHEYLFKMPLKKLIDTLDDIFTQKGFSELWRNFLIFMILLAITTTIHEATHVVTAYYLGCEGELAKISFFTGLSAIKCEDNSTKLIIISLSAPILLFLIGLYLWFSDSHPMVKIWALLCWFYGSLPSLSFFTSNTDANFALKHGLPPLWALLIFIIPTSIIAYLLSRNFKRELDMEKCSGLPQKELS
ncbi:MAG: hypothetical protein DRP23_01095 [Thermotogae bacterium]|nr:MAG: hypothetical protein DRP23_01095 [Thermotogota bacterium]